MEGVLSFVLFGVLFYVMMRYGCGAHMVHGHGAHGGQEHEGHGADDSGRRTRTTDPVCGMAVAADHGYTKVYDRQEYRFCSRACLDKFDADPQRYHSTSTGGMP